VNLPASDQDTLAKDELPQLFESSFEAIQTILTCSMHQKRIIDDILTLSKLDSRLLLITPIQVQPVSVVQEALKMFEVQAQNADVSLSYEKDESLVRNNVDWVMMDPSRVLQVLINLLTNAIKFTKLEAKRDVKVSIKASTRRPPREEGYIEARNSFRDDVQGSDSDNVYLHFVVRDTGRGLSTNEQARLFHRFAQASPRTHVKVSQYSLHWSTVALMNELLVWWVGSRSFR
jgi:signal transduction histidine kinase